MRKFKKIYIEITNICNLKCSFCSVDKRSKKQMSKEEFEVVLKKINKYTDYLYLHVKGEPLMHTNLDDILKLCNKYNKKVNITTNGTLLKKQVDILVKNNVRQVNISTHSLVGNYLTDILKSSEKLAQNNIYVVFRFWVYNEREKKTIDEILKYFNAENLKEKVYNENNVKICDNIFINKDTCFTWPSLDNEIISNTGTCLGLKTHIGILSDGTVIPCCLDSSGIINLGNIFEEQLSDILNKKRTQDIINNFNNNKYVEELCKKCGFKR